MEIKTRAIVFSALKYGEADLIVSCFTRSDGLKSYLQRGILKSKKGKIKTSYFQPLTQLELVAFHKNKGSLERIIEAKVIEPYQTLHTNMLKSGIVMFLAEMLRNSIKEEEANEALFDFLERSIYWLDRNESIANFHILFLLKLSAYLGFYPDSSSIEGQYFNLIEGNFMERPTGNYCEKGDEVSAIKEFFGIDFDALPAIKITKKTRLGTLNLLLVYYHLHMQSYKKPKSLAILNQLF